MHKVSFYKFTKQFTVHFDDQLTGFHTTPYTQGRKLQATIKTVTSNIGLNPPPHFHSH
jgi:hypothetical protein